MGLIDEDKIREIRDRSDIVEVIGRYLPLKKSGSNFQGLCPFHQEKSPSFNVNPPRQIYHCFGCGVGGNVFSFLMRIEGLTFPEAVRRLGEQVGIEVTEQETTPAELKIREQRQQLYRINQAAAELYTEILLNAPEGGAARRYLRQRSYDGEAVRHFGLGFAPDAWETLARHLSNLGFSRDVLLQSGLIRPGKQDRGDYDMFRNRLLFPIQDTQGRIVAFGGRVLDGSLPKYINSPESPIYHKGEVLYGLHQALDALRHGGEALVVEGYFDVMALHRAGFTQSLAPCGTALTPDHARLLKRYAERVVLVFDQDQAGRQATFKAMDVLLPTGMEVAVVSLPEGADPDSLLLKAGAQAFQDCLDQARPALDVFIEEQFSLQEQSIESQVKAAGLVMQRIRRLPNELQRDLYVKRLADLTGLDRKLLLGKARQQETPRPRKMPPSGPQPSDRSPAAVQQTTAATRSQFFLLRLMLLDDPGIRAAVRQGQTEDLFLDPPFKALADYLLSRENEEGRLPDDLCSSTLSAEQQTLLSSLLIEDEDPEWQEEAERIFTDCRRAVHQVRLRNRLHQLSRLEQEARACNDEQTLNKCLQERMAISSELKKKF